MVRATIRDFVASNPKLLRALLAGLVLLQAAGVALAEGGGTGTAGP
jgi:hypothetical protein